MCNAEDKKFYKSESWKLFFVTMFRVLVVCAAFLVFYGTYFMAEQTFSNPAYDISKHQEVTITVTSSDSEKDVAKQLKEKKLIYGTYRFRIRKYFSKYKDKSFLPGEYQFTQAQGMDDIMGILCGDHDVKETMQ